MKVDTIRWFSPAIGQVKSANVLLPANYSDKRSYPVLYLFHGYGGNRDTWLRRTTLIDHLGGANMIVVLPESGRYWFINDHQGRRYEDYLLDELLPYVERNFTAGGVRGYRAIGGFSMGGAAALFQALRYPNIFSVVASHSGAFEAPRRIGDPYAAHRAEHNFAMPSVGTHERVWGPPGSRTRCQYDPDRIVTSYDQHDPLSIYLDIGVHDYKRMIMMNRSMHHRLRMAGIPHHYSEKMGGHDWPYVNGALSSSLAFIRQHVAAPAPANV
jgi:S-formylglutathione hydrolase FrmB